MYALYTFAAAGLVFGFIIAIRSGWAGRYLLASLAGCTTGGAFVGLMFATSIFQALVPMRETTQSPRLLAAMRSADGVGGSFIFGSGNFRSQVSYHFLRKLENGSMVPATVQASDMVYLTEDPELKNVGYWIETIRECDPDSWQYNWAFSHHERTRTIKHEFRVPVGSVVQQFNIK